MTCAASPGPNRPGKETDGNDGADPPGRSTPAPQLADRALRVRDRMYPSEPPQRLIGKALGAERNAIDTRGSVTTEATVFDRARIGFERDLGIGGEVELRIQRIEQAREPVRRK